MRGTRRLRKSFLAFSLGLMLPLAACGSGTSVPPAAYGETDMADTPEQRLTVLNELDTRVNAVGYRLALSNVALCPDTGPVTGLLLHAESQYSDYLRPAARARWALDGDLPGIAAIAPDSPAAKAGLQIGDLLLSVNATPFAPGEQGRPAAFEGLTTNIARLHAAEDVDPIGRGEVAECIVEGDDLRAGMRFEPGRNRGIHLSDIDNRCLRIREVCFGIFRIARREFFCHRTKPGAGVVRRQPSMRVGAVVIVRLGILAGLVVIFPVFRMSLVIVGVTLLFFEGGVGAVEIAQGRRRMLEQCDGFGAGKAVDGTGEPRRQIFPDPDHQLRPFQHPCLTWLQGHRMRIGAILQEQFRLAHTGHDLRDERVDRRDIGDDLRRFGKGGQRGEGGGDEGQAHDLSGLQ